MSGFGLRLVASAHSTKSALSLSRAGAKCATRLGVAAASSSSRKLHTRKALPYAVEEGLGDFLPPDALKVVAVEYQQGLLNKLNDEVRGTENEDKSVAQTVINTAPLRSKTLAFNYASLALNNSFYLSMLKPPPSGSERNHEREIAVPLMGAIRDQYLTIEEFKSQFSAASLGLSSSGWIWCVVDENGQLAILPTHGAGTLLIRSRMQVAQDTSSVLEDGVLRNPSSFEKGNTTPPTSSQAFHSTPTLPSGVAPESPVSGVKTSPSSGGRDNLKPKFIHSSARSAFDLYANKPGSIYDRNLSVQDVPRTKVDYLNMGKELFPLFCVSVYEHNWLTAGYGVWGQEAWMKRFWSVLNWEKVSESYMRHASLRERS